MAARCDRWRGLASELRRATLTAVLFLALAAIGIYAALAFLPRPPPHLVARRIAFDQIPGWSEENLAPLWPVYLAACERLQKRDPDSAMGGSPIYGHVRDWLPACVAARAAPPDAARGFFEHWFRPVAIGDGSDERGLFTGYYEAEGRGALRAHDQYRTPLRRRPDDLLSADLGEFIPSLSGRRIFGRRVGDAFKPYPDRAAIEHGALDSKALEFVWLDDPIDAFFIEIQGSGRILLEDGSILHVSYAGQNGQPYTSLGGELLRRGALKRGSVTMEAIRDYLSSHPDEIAELLDANRSYVFFREAKAVGAAGATLTPKISLAVDPAFHPLNVPLFISVEAAQTGRAGLAVPFRHLMIAEDKGGAIKGVVRGDVFWGAGAEAAQNAGRMQNPGRLMALLPLTLAPR